MTAEEKGTVRPAVPRKKQLRKGKGDDLPKLPKNEKMQDFFRMEQDFFGN